MNGMELALMRAAIRVAAKTRDCKIIRFDLERDDIKVSAVGVSEQNTYNYTYVREGDSFFHNQAGEFFRKHCYVKNGCGPLAWFFDV